MVDILSRQGWTAARYGHDACDYDQVQDLLVILRDPVDRWTSGVAQYLMTRILNFTGNQSYIDQDANYDVEMHALSAPAFLISYNALIERFIFDNLDLLDDHVWIQAKFFENILPHIPRRYVVMNEIFQQNLQDLGIQTFEDGDRNASADDLDKDMLKHFFRERLDSKPSLLKKVQMTYARDYDLIHDACSII